MNAVASPSIVGSVVHTNAEKGILLNIEYTRISQVLVGDQTEVFVDL